TVMRTSTGRTERDRERERLFPGCGDGAAGIPCSDRRERDAIRGRRSPMTVRAVAGAVLGLSTVLAACGSTQGQDRKPPNASAPGQEDTTETPANALSRLVDQLQRHPAPHSKREVRLGVYLIDLPHGDVTLIADEPDPGANHCGSPRWSHDGKRILFDSM